MKDQNDFFAMSEVDDTPDVNEDIKLIGNDSVIIEALARLVEDKPLPAESTEKRTDAMQIMNEVEVDENEQ